MLVEMDLLDYLAYKTGCGVLSDLRLFSRSEQLRRIAAAIPLDACGTVSNRSQLCVRAGGKKPFGKIACKKTDPPRQGEGLHIW